MQALLIGRGSAAEGFARLAGNHIFVAGLAVCSRGGEMLARMAFLARGVATQGVLVESMLKDSGCQLVIPVAGGAWCGLITWQIEMVAGSTGRLDLP